MIQKMKRFLDKIVSIFYLWLIKRQVSRLTNRLLWTITSGDAELITLMGFMLQRESHIDELKRLGEVFVKHADEIAQIHSVDKWSDYILQK